MPAVQTDAIESRLARRLDPHGSEGVRAALSGVVDLESLEKRQYEDVLGAVDQRLSEARYSLLSMVVAGIYFGLLVGFWLVNGSTWGTIALWGIPVLLVTAYGLYSTHQTVRQIRHLSEARALLQLLMDGAPSPEDPDDA
ncbi:MAG: hypothetical protein BRD43_07325 [Bacteroidetes bacterium QS_4_64_154]|jgi:hypothetical protein|nr:MAG: hypothetical protein BRD26_03630 [Bacteroidetes bacterium QH_1_64_81]PSQ86543.1 MAG: hypothetical protein BRD43_07325 [Bacteroidetes bacterium QS_4_64_154]